MCKKMVKPLCFLSTLPIHQPSLNLAILRTMVQPRDVREHIIKCKLNAQIGGLFNLFVFESSKTAARCPSDIFESAENALGECAKHRLPAEIE